MSTRIFRLFSGGLLAAAAVSAAPNVVMILVDDLGWRDTSCYGSDVYETPHVDRLATSGVRFTQAYAAHPRCVPSRTGLFTGKYPARLGVPGVRRGPHAMPLGETSLGEAFRANGYTTCYIDCSTHLGGP
ncbi:MAG: sulfatase-like hydrolase/transferase [Lentisphaerae bacterium]|jgi:arylsulfatase A-like enzyme|nr:sulfatase-like hydrolase/transferase [Lentisphaerota bacterium]MBT4817447.1 sulfatase-like hydrolase/transferase [Lentisphaerota bacterium]MBT5612527.1 sulfatase-like hydrolase/transferase [Lentisphaerota bacterium]MBT7061322.1 sulfatase-like hydrolase/transferase [Lentisphaerota bacterium]MBT7840463.1 sulfatase-like hydrolase/transferase [Lentisphaerota bacterium]